MTPLLTKHTTNVLGAPNGWDADKKGPCLGLPVAKLHGNYYSYWKPTLKERFKIIIGKPITLVVSCESHPPVAMEIN